MLCATPFWATLLLFEPHSYILRPELYFTLYKCFSDIQFIFYRVNFLIILGTQVKKHINLVFYNFDTETFDIHALNMYTGYEILRKFA